MNKTCRRCRIEKSETEFYKNKRGHGLKIGPHPYCKECQKAANRERYRTRPEVRARNIASAKASNKLTVALRSQRAAEKYRTDPEVRRRSADNQRRLYQRYRNDPAYRIRKAVSAAIRKAIGAAKGRTSWFDIVGYSRDELRRHLERQFVTGMFWHNYGDWHIDHITPVASFDFRSDPLEVARIAWALPNLRPFWKADNMRKHAKRTHLI
jgi:hypothetical protein